MTQEEKELLIKDLSGRIPYRHNFWLQVREFDEDAPSNRRMLTDYIDEIDNGWVVECKPYLRPMSSMTEEETKEYIEYAGYEIEESVNGRHYEYYLKDFCGTPNNPSVNADSVDWLNKNMFDYRGLIPKGLALEAPEGMYNN